MSGYIGQRVRMTWAGGARDGVLSGDFRLDALPTGATFVPVTWDDDGTTDNVDTRVLSSLNTEERIRCAAHTAPSDWTARCTCPSHMTLSEESAR